MEKVLLVPDNLSHTTVYTPLQSPKTTSRLVTETVTILKELSVFSSVRLLWVSGHSGVDGNEVADSLATQASYSDFIGPEPAISITVTTVRSEIRSWVNKEHLKHWQATPACRQAKSLIHGLDRQLTQSALGLWRRELKVLVGLLTGHDT